MRISCLEDLEKVKNYIFENVSARFEEFEKIVKFNSFFLLTNLIIQRDISSMSKSTLIESKKLCETRIGEIGDSI